MFALVASPFACAAALTAPHDSCPMTTSSGMCRCSAPYSRRRKNRLVDHFTGRADHEQLAQADVEDVFRRHSRVGAREHHRRRVLARGKLLTTVHTERCRRRGVPHIAVVPRLQQAKGLLRRVGGQQRRHRRQPSPTPSTIATAAVTRNLTVIDTPGVWNATMEIDRQRQILSVLRNCTGRPSVRGLDLQGHQSSRSVGGGAFRPHGCQCEEAARAVCRAVVARAGGTAGSVVGCNDSARFPRPATSANTCGSCPRGRIIWARHTASRTPSGFSRSSRSGAGTRGSRPTTCSFRRRRSGWSRWWRRPGSRRRWRSRRSRSIRRRGRRPSSFRRSTRTRSTAT